MGPDELERWQDDDLVRALRAPGTPAELAGEERYVAAFRAAHRRRGTVTPLRRGIRRLGAGGTAVIVTVGLSSGVAAAAYTRHLPDPVQQVVHEVLGAPAPEHDPTVEVAPRHDKTPPTEDPATQGSPPTSEPTTSVPTLSPSPTAPATPAAPTGDPTSAPTAEPSGTPTTAPTPTATPTATPTETPTDTPTGTPTPPPPVPASVTLGGTTHRTGPGASVTLTGTVSAADGTPVPDQHVQLEVRGPERWRQVADATADAAGAVSFATPPATATARYRLVAPGLHSDVWRVVLVPTVTATATPAGDQVEIAATVGGGRGGDRVVLLRQGPRRLLAASQGALDAEGRVLFRVAARDRTTTYVVRLPATAAHGRAATRLSVVPLRPATIGISAAAHQVGPGGSLSIAGVVRAADGTPVAGREVVLQVREPESWRAVATAVTDTTGAVSLATPVLDRTAVYRLTAGGVHSDRWRVVLVPALQATVTAGDPADIAANGGRAGDTVSLLRRVDGRLVVVQRTGLAADGTAHFQVTPGTVATTYVVRLLPTPVHGAARTLVEVPAARAAGP